MNPQEQRSTVKSAVEKHKEFLFPAVATYYQEPLALVKGEGEYVWDDQGKRYLDCFGGVLTVSVGQGNTRGNAGGKEGRSGMTGLWGLRHGVGGGSATALASVGHKTWRPVSAQVPGIVHAAAPYCYRCPFKLEYPSCGVACADDVEDIINTTTTGNIAAFMAETILGVGGFIVPPKEYFPRVAEIARRHGGLFISDEVQAAWGRTGDKWFGIEHWGVDPDIITSAKGMGNGVPIGWTIATPEVADAFPGLTFSTFGGNPVSMAVGLAVIKVIEEDDLRTNARVVGDYFHGRLLELKEKHRCVGDVRGMGLMQGIELVKDRQTKEPAPDLVLRVFEETKRQGVLVGKGGLYGNVIRTGLMLNSTTDTVDKLVAALDAGLALC